MKKAEGKRPALKEVLRVLAEPSLRLCFEHPYFARLLSRLRHDPDDTLWPAYRAAQAELTEGFRKAFAAALPNLPAGEVRTRLHYLLGATQQVWSHCPRPAGGAARELPHLLRRGHERASARRDRVELTDDYEPFGRATH